MMKDTISILNENYDLVIVLAAVYNVDMEPVAEYEDMTEIDVTGADIAEFVVAVNGL